MLNKSDMLNIREFEINDAPTVFNWRNEPYIVNLGSLKKGVTWDEHLNWFKNTLKGTDRRAFILQINNTPAGQVRFDRETQDSCFISVYLIEEFSGKGYGIEFIKLGSKKIFSEWKNIKNIYALVKMDNTVGQKAFIKADFIEDKSYQDKGHLLYVLKRT